MKYNKYKTIASSVFSYNMALSDIEIYDTNMRLYCKYKPEPYVLTFIKRTLR